MPRIDIVVKMARHFKNKKAYRKFTDYVVMHHLGKRHPPYVYIGSKKHYIKRRRK